MSRTRTVDEVQRGALIRLGAGVLVLVAVFALDLVGVPSWVGVALGALGWALVLAGVSRHGEARGRRNGSRQQARAFQAGFRMGQLDVGRGRVMIEGER